jgi:hypothetical protein
MINTQDIAEFLNINENNLGRLAFDTFGASSRFREFDLWKEGNLDPLVNHPLVKKLWPDLTVTLPSLTTEADNFFEEKLMPLIRPALNINPDIIYGAEIAIPYVDSAGDVESLIYKKAVSAFSSESVFDQAFDIPEEKITYDFFIKQE